MSSQSIENCFNALKTLRKIDAIRKTIDDFFPIAEPVVEPLQRTQNSREFGLYGQETPFAPAPALIKTYQETFTRANQDQRITNTKNYKLEANFSTPAPQRNEMARQNKVKIMEQAVMIEDREAIILDQLRTGKIEATIPQMQKTLFTNELSHLDQKEVVIENTLSISEWKKLRNRFAK